MKLPFNIRKSEYTAQKIRENMKKKNSLFTTDYNMAFTASLLMRLAMQYKITLIPLYMISLGYTKMQAGLAMTVFTIFALVFRPISGNLIEKTGRTKMLFTGMLFFSLTTLPFGFFGNITMLYLLQGVSGLSFSLMSIALTTIITDIVPEEKLVNGLGYFGLTATVTQALGPFLAIWSYKRFSFSELFLSAGLVMAAALISLKFITYEKDRSFRNTSDGGKADTADSPTRRFIDKIVERKAVAPSFIIGCLSMATASTTSFLVPYAEVEKISGIGIFFIARALGLTLSRVFAGQMIRMMGERRMISLAIGEMILGIGGVYLVRTTPLIFTIAFLYGMGFGLSHVLFNVAAVKKTNPSRRAFANATFYLFMDVGIGIGSVLWGGIGDLFGMGAIFPAAAVFTALVLLWFRLLKNHI